MNWFQYNQKCYFTSANIFSQYLTWRNAEKFCNANGGFLVSIHSISEQRFITSKVNKRFLVLIMNFKISFELLDDKDC